MASVPPAARPLPQPPVSARSLAWRILNDTDAQHGWAEDLLATALHKHPLDPADARLLRELVFGTLKARLFLDYVLGHYFQSGSRPAKPVMNLLRLGAYQLLMLSKIPPHAAVHATVEMGKAVLEARRISFCNAVLREISRKGVPALPPENQTAAFLSVRHSFPLWLAERWLNRFGRESAEALMQAANEAPPLVARVNRLRGSRENALRMLERAGIAAETLEAPQALLISGHDPARIPGTREGWFYFQDMGSQWLGYLADPQPGQVGLDYCSAPGGKTTHWAELMRNEGTIWAHDRSAAKLARVRENANRLGATCIKTAAALPAGLLADRVLVDAPCSGLGTLRRHAEGRWRVVEKDLARLAAGQRALLKQAAARLKPGGHLIYATCTTEPEENEDVVRAFLAEHPGFALKPGPGASGLPPRAYWGTDGFFRTYPQHPDMDAMFAARLLRQA